MTVSTTGDAPKTFQRARRAPASAVLTVLLGALACGSRDSEMVGQPDADLPCDELVDLFYDYRLDRNSCETADDCVIVGISRTDRNCDADIAIVINSPALPGAQELFSRVISGCKADELPGSCDDYSGPDPICVQQVCRRELIAW